MKEGKLDRSRRIAETAAHNASCAAEAAEKASTEAAKRAVEVEGAAEGMKMARADVESALARILGEFDKRVVETRVALVKEADAAQGAFTGACAGLQALIDAARWAVREATQAAGLAAEKAGVAQGAYGRLKELGIKPIPPEDPLSPEEVAEVVENATEAEKTARAAVKELAFGMTEEEAAAEAAARG